MTPTDAVHSTV